MAERHVPASDAGRGRQRRRLPVQGEPGRSVTTAHHLDVVEGDGTEADPEGLPDRFFGREPGRQPDHGVGSPTGAVALGRCEHPLGEPRAAGEHPPEPLRVHRVDTDTHDGAADGTGHVLEGHPAGGGRPRRARRPCHSTVTTLARLRGRSTSWPSRRASE